MTQENAKSAAGRFPPNVLAEVDAWAASHPAKVTRSAAIVALVVAGLAAVKGSPVARRASPEKRTGKGGGK